MKRLVLSLASVCAVSLLSGCCAPMWSPFGGCNSGCATGGCAPGGFGPTGYNQGVGTIQTGYPQGPVAISPYGQQMAYPQMLQPTIAMDSLPTYR
jgi:hypothetical protein